MSQFYNGASFARIVYARVAVNGRTTLVPLEQYVDGSLKRGDSWLGSGATSPLTTSKQLAQVALADLSH